MKNTTKLRLVKTLDMAANIASLACVIYVVTFIVFRW